MQATDHHSIYADHRRDWKSNLYVYPVISRRSHGLSIGVNLNPDKACNFDCIYCQVDRSPPGPTRGVDLDILRAELDHMIRIALDETLFSDGKFADAPPELREAAYTEFAIYLMSQYQRPHDPYYDRFKNGFQWRKVPGTEIPVMVVSDKFVLFTLNSPETIAQLPGSGLIDLDDLAPHNTNVQ